MTAAQLEQLIDRFLDPALSNSQKQELAREVEAHLEAFPQLRVSWQGAQQTLQFLASAREIEAPAPNFLRSNVRAALVEQSARAHSKPPFWLQFARPMWAGGALGALALLLVAKDYFGPNAPPLAPRETPESAIVSQNKTESIARKKTASASPARRESVQVLPTATPRPTNGKIFVGEFQPARNPTIGESRAPSPVLQTPRAAPAPSPRSSPRSLEAPNSGNAARPQSQRPRVAETLARQTPQQRVFSLPQAARNARLPTQNERETASTFAAPLSKSPNDSAMNDSAPSVLEPVPAEKIAPPAPAPAVSGANRARAAAPPRNLESDIASSSPLDSINSAALRADADLDASIFSLAAKERPASRQMQRGGESNARMAIPASRRVQIELRSARELKNVRLLSGEQEIWRGNLSSKTPLQLVIFLPNAQEEIELGLEKLPTRGPTANAKMQALESQNAALSRVILRAPLEQATRP